MTSLRSVADSLFGKQSFTFLELDNNKIIFRTDCNVTEVYNKQAAVSTYPIENGGELGENSSLQSFTIAINAVTSDATMSYFDLVNAAGSSPIGQAANLFGFNVSTNSQKAWDQLNKWMDNGTPLIIKCKFAPKGFTDKNGKNQPFVIESLSVPRDKNTGSAIRYNLTLRQLKIVEIGAASVTDVSLGVTDKGAQQLKDNEASSSVEGQSNAAMTVDPLVDNPEYQAFLNF